jgi:hypothetical protein
LIFFFPTTLDTIFSFWNSYLPLQPTYHPSSYLPLSDITLLCSCSLSSIASTWDSVWPSLGFRASNLQNLRGVKRKKRSLEHPSHLRGTSSAPSSREREEKRSYKESSIPFYVFFGHEHHHVEVIKCCTPDLWSFDFLPGAQMPCFQHMPCAKKNWDMILIPHNSAMVHPTSVCLTWPLTSTVNMLWNLRWKILSIVLRQCNKNK